MSSTHSQHVKEVIRTHSRYKPCGKYFDILNSRERLELMHKVKVLEVVNFSHNRYQDYDFRQETSVLPEKRGEAKTSYPDDVCYEGDEAEDTVAEKSYQEDKKLIEKREEVKTSYPDDVCYGGDEAEDTVA